MICAKWLPPECASSKWNATTIKAATQAVEYLIVGLGGEIDRLCIHVEIGVLSVMSTAKISIPREKKEKYWKNRPQSIPVSVQIV